MSDIEEHSHFSSEKSSLSSSPVEWCTNLNDLNKMRNQASMPMFTTVRPPQTFYARTAGPPSQPPRMANHNTRPQPSVFTSSQPQYMYLPTAQMNTVPYTYNSQRPAGFVPQVPVHQFHIPYPYGTTPPQTQPVSYNYFPQMMRRTNTIPQSAAGNPNSIQNPLPNVPLVPNTPHQFQRQPPNKKRARALAIIEPDTGHDRLQVMFEDSSQPLSDDESSARQTPQPSAVQSHNKQVQAAFAQQVLQAINDNTTTPIDHHKYTSTQPHQAIHVQHDKSHSSKPTHQVQKKHQLKIALQSSKLQVGIKDVVRHNVSTISQDEPDRAALTQSNEKIMVQAKNDVNAKTSESNKIDNKLPYADANQNGVMKYPIDFLLALKDAPASKVPPENILDAVVADVREPLSDGRSSMSRTDFNPPIYYGRKRSQKGPLPRRLRGSKMDIGKGTKGSTAKPAMEVPISVREEVKLHESENVWRPARFNTGEFATDEDKKTEELYRKVRGILNKLTPQKFDTLLQKIRSLAIDTEPRLQGVIDLVFEKAVDEPNFSVAYAGMCGHLALLQVPCQNPDEKSEFVNFRKLLITKCQVEFEKQSVDEKIKATKLKEIEACTDPEERKDLQFELEEYFRRVRIKAVGNTRFIGELFKQNMLTQNKMMRCLNMLLDNGDDLSLECLCVLLTIIGKELNNKNVQLTTIFKQIRNLANKKENSKISTRIRFMLQDVIDLRNSKWVPRRQDLNPKMIDQIQKEAEQEQLTIQMMNSVPMTSRKDDISSGSNQGSINDRKGGRGSNRSVSDEGWINENSNRGNDIFSVTSDKLKAGKTKFEFLLGGPSPVAVNSISYPEVEKKLLNFFKADRNIDDIYDWVTTTVGDQGIKEKKFIRALATAIFEDSINKNHKLSDARLEQHNMLLIKYVDSNPGFELECLYALQALVQRIEHPQGLLLQIFNKLYEGGTISQESFIAWEQSQDPAEQEGKIIALKQLTSFFCQLKENESSSEDEDDESSVSENDDELLVSEQLYEAGTISKENFTDCEQSQDPAAQEGIRPSTSDVQLRNERIINTLDGYISGSSNSEQLFTETISSLVTECYIHVLEKSSEARLKTGGLFAELIVQGKISTDDYCAGLENVLSKLDDIPNWDSYAEILVDLICEEALPLKDLHKCMKILIKQEQADQLLAPLFKLVIKYNGSDFLKNQWNMSELQFSDFMNKSQVESFITEHRFEFLSGEPL